MRKIKTKMVGIKEKELKSSFFFSDYGSKRDKVIEQR